MIIGTLNKRITIQHKTKVADGIGGHVDTWVDYATVFAAIWDATGNELNAAGSTSLIITHKIRIRYRSAVKAGYRIKYGTRFFNIISIVNPNESNRQLDLLCKEAA